MRKLLLYIHAISPITLLSSLLSACIGLTLSVKTGHVNVLNSILVFLGLLLLHTAVNLYNDYCDYKSGVDLMYRRMHVLHRTSLIIDLGVNPRHVRDIALLLVAIAVSIGTYIMLSIGQVQIIVLLIALGLLIGLGYSGGLRLRYHGLGEVFAGIAIGPLVSLGSYVAISGSLDYAATAAILGIPNGLFTTVILMLIGAKRAHVDKLVGKRTLATKIGPEKCTRVAVTLLYIAYALIVAYVMARELSPVSLLGLLAMFSHLGNLNVKRLFLARTIVTLFICLGLLL